MVDVEALLGPIVPVGSRKLDKAYRIWLDIHA